MAERKLVRDGSVVLADECRRVNEHGGAVPTVVCRKLMPDRRAALAGGDKESLRDGRGVGTDLVGSIGSAVWPEGMMRGEYGVQGT